MKILLISEARGDELEKLILEISLKVNKFISAVHLYRAQPKMVDAFFEDLPQKSETVSLIIFHQLGEEIVKEIKKKIPKEHKRSYLLFVGLYDGDKSIFDEYVIRPAVWDISKFLSLHY